MQGIVSGVLELHQNQQKVKRLCIVKILWLIFTTKKYFCYGKEKMKKYRLRSVSVLTRAVTLSDL